ncbi:hypothetical protein LOTGIDRAFT_237618 [Lottia gigantea]|uniref:Peptide-N(4)-(N-acetyl-beta-glucosaminyl)asparagine amidase n=1 Tax=Lottia gigantea TaxID=225164 RepID=V4B7N8_LOTGI|nr:hypothetical protein LOTGIDRAFT_237618 [Lottia gigantea]ESP03621.1 hypothetical protein LOTGIDRAFT_237618 [Lottia gigantea]
MTWDSVKQIINENESKSSLDAIDILLKYCNNILNNPRDPKYRRIRLKNAVVENKLLPVVGAMECLFDMGFLEDGEYLSLPENCSLSILTVIKNELTTEKDALLNNEKSTTPVSIQPAPQVTSTQPSHSISNNILTQNMIVSEAKFYSKLQSSLQHVLIYEDRTLQTKAKQVIPLDRLEIDARERLNSLQSPSSDQQIDFQDCLLLSLLHWFKTEFFSWVDAPACERCTGPTRSIGMVEPSLEETRWQGHRVESYQCNVCALLTRFPRYNHPGKLLETRKGRCGEWANCFTLCCRAVGFEARYVLDWTDHVWTEVYSQSQKRWMHCDPCENVCDKPLLYESGWGKKLTYIIAFSKDDIMDVTWRYSAKHSQILSRRQECREDWLVRTIHKMNKGKLDVMGPARKDVMLKRIIVELVEFLKVKTANNSQLSGRTTGSLAWRLARGETGNMDQNSEFIFHLSEQEKQSKQLHILYNCASDQYVRRSNNNETTKTWSSLCYNHLSIFRKEEKDWKMVYLAREEGSSNASVFWKFDFSDSKLRIDNVSLKCHSSVFENGEISWKICGDDQCHVYRGTELTQLTNIDVKGSTTLNITATLTKGTGDNAWQHTQLFRQSSDDKNTYPFELLIKFTDL